MINPPKVSIVVPIYNVEKYIDRCVLSLINQTLKDIEIILIDDGSPDNCPRICDDYADKDSRIKVLHKVNAGQGLARNDGIKLATGKYIAFIDSDDYADTIMFESLYENAEDNNLDICCCSFKRFYDNGRVVPAKWNKDNIMVVDKAGIENIAMSLHHTTKDTILGTNVWGVLYSRDVICRFDIKFVSEREFASEDLIFNMDYLIHTNRIGYIPKHYYNYYYNNNSTTTNYNKAKYDRLIKLLYLVEAKLSVLYDRELYQQYFAFSALRIFKVILKFEVLKASSTSEGILSLKRSLSEPIFKIMLECIEFKRAVSSYNRLLLYLFKNNNYILLYYIQVIKLKLKR
ncbi:MAG: glycosyltransferase [Rikenellaceae bacterium]